MNQNVELEKVKREAEKYGLPCPELTIPAEWRMLTKGYDGFLCERWDGLRVVVSEAKELDGKKWRHVSASRKTRVPDYFEMVSVKNLFIGRDKKAIQIFPQESNHVNLHRFCLHLFSCLDADPLPEFSHGLGSI